MILEIVCTLEKPRGFLIIPVPHLQRLQSNQFELWHGFGPLFIPRAPLIYRKVSEQFLSAHSGSCSCPYKMWLVAQQYLGDNYKN